MTLLSPADWSCPGPGWSCLRPVTGPVRQQGCFRSRSSALGAVRTLHTWPSRYQGESSPTQHCPLTAVSVGAQGVCGVLVQVEEGTAKPGRDFTHSSAALIQFDPGKTGSDYSLNWTNLSFYQLTSFIAHHHCRQGTSDVWVSVFPPGSWTAKLFTTFLEDRG